MNSLQMVKAIKAGDMDAFDQLYETYHLPLYRTAYLLLANSQDAEDALQETFIAAYKNIGSLKGPYKVKAWLYAILKNKANRQAMKRNREWPDQYILEKIDLFKREESQEDNLAIKNDLEKCLRELNPKHREVIVLYYYNDFSIEEIAKICGSFQGTIKSRLYKARKELKKKLSQGQVEYLTLERKNIHERKIQSRV